MRQAGWHFVCRTAKNVRLAEAGWAKATFCLFDLMADGLLRLGTAIELPAFCSQCKVWG